MSATGANPADAPLVQDREIMLSRLFEAPRPLVWSAWSDPDQIRRWWGPKGFAAGIEEFDFRPGGSWRFVMRDADGVEFPNHNLFVAIRKPELIVMDHLADPKFRLTVGFEQAGDRTRLTIRQLFESAHALEIVRPLAIPGGQEMLDKLARRLAAMGG